MLAFHGVNVGLGVRIRDACESAASNVSLKLRWNEFIDDFFVACEGGSGRIERNILAQFEAAIGTLRFSELTPPYTIAFLFNRTGRPKPMTPVIDVTDLITANFIGSCAVSSSQSEECWASNDIVAVWIDDLRVLMPQQEVRGSLRSFLHRRYPALLDVLRNRRNERIRSRMLAALKGAGELAAPHPLKHKAHQRYQKTVLFCLYWLDVGGAESFALQAMSAAQKAGFRVAVICDELGRHALIEKAREFAYAIYLLGNFGPARRDDAFLRIVQHHSPEIVHIHHSFIAYRRLPIISALCLTNRVIDTTHIIEAAGDFPRESVLYSRYINQHHVISKDLFEFYSKTAGISPAGISLGYLCDLSRNFRANDGKWKDRTLLRVAFVGRFTQQKRPYLFLHVAKRLTRRFGKDRFKFEMVGEGPLRVGTEALAKRMGISDIVSFLPSDTPVHELLFTAHALVICSENEGLTLVGFEGIRSDCLLISSDVGSQRELVCSEMLVSSRPLACIRQTAARLTQLAIDQLDVYGMLKQQRAKLTQIENDLTGHDVCSNFYLNVTGSTKDAGDSSHGAVGR